MEDERNLTSSTTSYLMVGDYDSGASNYLLPQKHNIHAREDNTCISDSRFKGVVGEHSGHAKGDVEFSYKQLFQKKLTPSDVGKHNRLVIPKKYATKYFPQIQDEEMIFYDTSRTLWKFRYHYSKSSQSFVFTKGWINFVKDKDLRAKDIIVFNLCEFKNGTKVNCNTFVIDVVKNIEVAQMDLPLNHHQEEEIIDDHEVETKEFMRAQPFNHVVVAATALVPVCLFGKQIGWTEKKENEV